MKNIGRRMADARALLARARKALEWIEADSGAELMPAQIGALRAELDALQLAYDQIALRKKEAAAKWAVLIGADPHYLLPAEIGSRVLRTIR